MSKTVTTITIHRGELLQIKRIIIRDKKTKNLKGRLYGLYTESDQPVVLIVCGGVKNTKKIDDYLWEKHKLLPLGEWIVSIVPNSKKDQKDSNSSKKTDTLTFDNEGEVVSAHFRCKEANLDVIEGQSAFRECQSLTKYLHDKTNLDSSPITIEEKQMPSEHQPHGTDDVSCCTRTSQWYNTDRDTFQNTFNFVRSAFSDDGMVEVSRNTSTEDMFFKFNHSQFSWVIEFSAEFPSGNVILRRIKDSEEKVSPLQQHTANLANMKNMLRENFFNMCKCQKCCSREPQSWV